MANLINMGDKCGGKRKIRDCT